MSTKSYLNFRKLLQEKGVTAYRVSKETGIAQSTFSDWKNGRSEPKIDKLQKIADFFKVGIERFGESDIKKEEPAVNKDDEQTNDDPITQEIIKKVKQLSAESQKKAADYILLLSLGDEKHNQEP